MTVTMLTRRPRVASGSPGTRAEGSPMQPSPLLDLVERLLEAAAHPDIVKIERYGPGQGPWGPDVETSKAKGITGVKVRHQSTATASVWEAVWPGEKPVEAPAVLPVPRQNRAPRLLILLKQLLDAARPEQLRSWQLVTLPKLGRTEEQAGLPFGLSIETAGGNHLLLRASATGPTVGVDPEEQIFTDYVIPEGVKTCLQADAVSAGR